MLLITFLTCPSKMFFFLISQSPLEEAPPAAEEFHYFYNLPWSQQGERKVQVSASRWQESMMSGQETTRSVKGGWANC